MYVSPWLSNTAHAQVIDITKYSLTLGFYGGMAGYLGDYNPSFLGEPYSYTFADNPATTSNQFLTGDLAFGVRADYPLKRWLEARLNFENGTLSYLDNTSLFEFSTPYWSLTGGVSIFPFGAGNFTPYLGLGGGIYNFVVPQSSYVVPIDPGLPNNPPAGQSLNAIATPITLGFTFDLDELARLFIESTVTVIFDDRVDNFQPVNSTFPIKQDAMISFQIGMSIRIFDVIRLSMPSTKKVKQLAAKSYEIPIEWNPPSPSLAAVPGFGSESSGLDTNLAQAEDSVKAPIPVVDLDNRAFDADAELDKVTEMREEAKLRARERAENGEEDPFINSNLGWDPSIPIIVTTPNPIPRDIVENGIATDFPPPGYYVQGYASVGPITAGRARQTVIRALRGIVADPEAQTIIVRRNQFYEVRVGVFDTYDDTYEVLKALQGTFFDSYSLIYLPQ